MQNNSPVDEVIRSSPAILSLLKLESGIGLPEHGEPSLEHFLFERYAGEGSDWSRRVYYALKPLIPRQLQLALRRMYAGRQAKRTFPGWPFEPCLVRMVDRFFVELIVRNRLEAIHRIAPWPAGRRFAFAITHDVEWDTGLSRAPELAEIERQSGFLSSWNLVPERYTIDWRIVDRLRAEGCEIGVHGLRHDGKLFQSRRHFRNAVGTLNGYARTWNAVGFRSESTLRNAGWMSSLAFEYDSSFPDTDPYEPQPGGCCSIWPYFIGNLVELPITLPQDHTLFEILGRDDISIWKEKADWIEQLGGLVLINVHPDYIFSGNRFRLYGEFLAHMKDKVGMWQALPKEIAGWWRDRDRSVLVRRNGEFVVEGPIAGRSSILKSAIERGILQHRIIGSDGNDLRDYLTNQESVPQET